MPDNNHHDSLFILFVCKKCSYLSKKCVTKLGKANLKTEQNEYCLETFTGILTNEGETL
jgi:hypothetical protein